MPDLITRATLDLALLQKPQGHKYEHGHVLVLSGGPAQTGAARLAARGALRIGAGAVTLGVPVDAVPVVAPALTSIMLTPLADQNALSRVLDDTRINALCLGPALGLQEDQKVLVAGALESGRPCVLDADALTLLAQDSDLMALLHDRCVLTPHPGEFARLFPDIAGRMKNGPAFLRSEGMRAAATRAGCTVLLKGPQTMIAEPEGLVRMHDATGPRAVPWLATAGSGDVLAGFIAGLLARKFAPLQAASWGVWLHAACAAHFGPGLIAEDLPEELPHVLRALHDVEAPAEESP
ncbi:MAG: NAD(P)H-hydrate dehydratase [Pseudomonadota bacterium]